MGLFDAFDDYKKLKATEEIRKSINPEKIMEEIQAEQKAIKEEKLKQEIIKSEKDEKFSKINEDDLSKITISTSNICQEYEVLGIVYAQEIELRYEGEALRDIHFSKIFLTLKKECYLLGGDAIINYQVNIIPSQIAFDSSSSMGEGQYFRSMMLIYAQGTAIKVI